MRKMLFTSFVVAMVMLGAVLWLNWLAAVRCDPRYLPSCVAIDEPRY